MFNFNPIPTSVVGGSNSTPVQLNTQDLQDNMKYVLKQLENHQSTYNPAGNLNN